MSDNATSSDNATASDNECNAAPDGGRQEDEVVFSDPATETFSFWFEGALITGVSGLGLAFNLVAVVILLRPRMKGSFHTLLVSRSRPRSPLAFGPSRFLMEAISGGEEEGERPT